MGSFWGCVLIYKHLSLFVCEMRSSTRSGLLGAPCDNTGIEKLWRVWQFERLFPVMIPFILILSWLTKHFPILCCAFWKQISNTENVIFFTHSPTGCSHSTSLQLGPLSSYYISLRGSSTPGFRASPCSHVYLLKILHFPYIPISFDPRD